MTERQDHGQLARTGGFALALLVGWLLAAAPAQAGCGDHVRPHFAAGLAPANAPGPTPDRPDCTGPACRRLPQTPAPTPSVPPVGADDVAACLAAPGDSPPTRAAPAPPGAGPGRRIHRTRGIFHPPRLLPG